MSKFRATSAKKEMRRDLLHAIRTVDWRWVGLAIFFLRRWLMKTILFSILCGAALLATGCGEGSISGPLFSDVASDDSDRYEQQK